MKIDNRSFLDDGTVLCQEAAIVEMLYNDLSLDTVTAEPSDDIELYNKTDKYLDTNYGKIEVASDPQYTNTNWFEYWLTLTQRLSFRPFLIPQNTIDRSMARHL